jgi:hypothetical protein
MSTSLTRQVHEMNLKGVLLVLVNGNVAHLKTRDNIRALFVFAVSGVEILARERNSIGGDFDQMAVKYFDIAKRYCLNGNDYQKLLLKYETSLSMDIEKTMQEMSPLGYSGPFPLSSSRPSDWDALVSKEMDSDGEEEQQTIAVVEGEKVE